MAKINYSEMAAPQIEHTIESLPIVTVSLSDIKPPERERVNVRHHGQVERKAITLLGLMQRNGQHSPVVLERNGDGKADTLKGFIRLTAFELAKKEKRQFIGGPYAGKLMADNIRARVVDGPLNPQVRAALIADHEGVTGLDVAGLAKTVMTLRREGLTESEIILKERPLLDEMYPLSEERAKTVVDDATYCAARHGSAPLVWWLKWYDIPVALVDMYLDKLEYNRRHPTDTEMKTLVGQYRNEQKSNPKVTPASPGPQFTAEFKAAQAEWEEEAKGGGTTKGKAKGMMKQTDLLKRAGSAHAVPFRLCLMLVRFAEKGRQWNVLDKALAEYIRDTSDKSPAAWKKLDAAMDEVAKAIPSAEPAETEDAE